MSSRAVESSFSWLRLKQAIPVREISSFSVICLFRVLGAGLLRHASDIRKRCEGQSVYKDKVKWWGNYQINDLVVFNKFDGSDYQLPQRLKLLDCFPYVMESGGVYEIY